MIFQSRCSDCGAELPIGPSRPARDSCVACGAPRHDAEPNDESSLSDPSAPSADGDAPSADDWPSGSPTLPPHAESDKTGTARDDATLAGSGDSSGSRVPDQIGDYFIEEEIARGGMGVVYRARHKRISRVVALKVIRSAELASLEEMRRFENEAEAAASLDHPAIVPIYDIGEVNGQHFYTMRFVDGSSLADLLQEGPLLPRHAAAMVATVADAIHYAHTQEVVHRDLKPANILLVQRQGASRGSASTRGSSVGKTVGSGLRRDDSDDGFEWQPQITDFGLAKQLQSEVELTTPGQLLGTPSYMPPEQARGDANIGQAADIYSLGAVLYAALAGRPPFQSANAAQTIKQVLEQDPVAPSRISGDIERDLDNICLKCLEKSPSRRYASAGELADDLYAFLEGRPVKARPIGPVERVARWYRRNPMEAAAIMAGAACALALVVLALVTMRLQLTRETARRLEREGVVREKSLRLAEERSANAQQRAVEREFSDLVSQVRERNAYAEYGWATQGLDNLRQALQLDVEFHTLRLRNTLARCLTGVDARIVAEEPMPPGFRSHRVAVDRRHRRFAVATLKNRLMLRVAVCKYPSGEQLHVLNALPRSLIAFDGIRHVAFLDEGDTLAIVSRTGLLHRWDLTRQEPPLTTTPVPFEVDERLTFDPSGKGAILCHDGKAYRWPDFSSIETELLAEDVNVVWDVSPDGKLAVVRKQGVAHIVRLPSMATVFKRPDAIRGWFDDHQHLVLNLGAELAMVDAETGEAVQGFRDPLNASLHDGGVRNLDVSPDGALLVSGGADQNVTLWDVASGRQLVSVFLGGDDEIYPVFGSDRHILTTGDRRGVVLEVNGRDTAGTVALDHRIDSFDVSVDPARIVAGGQGLERAATVSVWNAAGNVQLDRRTIGGEPVRPIVRTNSMASHVAVGTWDANRIWAWKLSPRQRGDDRTPPAAADQNEQEDSAGDPYGIRTMACRRPRACEVDDTGAGWFLLDDHVLVRRSLEDLDELSRWSNALASQWMGVGRISDLEARGDRVTALMMSGQLAVFPVADLSKVSKKSTQCNGTAVAVNPAQTLAAYGTIDGELRFVPLADREFESVIQAGSTEGVDGQRHSEFIASLAFSPDGKLLASSSRDRTIRLWKVGERAATPVLTLKLDRTAQRLRFLPSGDLLASLESEIGLRVWRLQRLRQRLAKVDLDW